MSHLPSWEGGDTRASPHPHGLMHSRCSAPASGSPLSSKKEARRSSPAAVAPPRPLPAPPGVFGLSLFDGEVRPLSVCYLPAWGAEEVGVVEPSWPSDGGGRRGARRDVESPKRCAPSNGGSSPSAASVDCRAACPCGADRRAYRASPTPRVHQRILLGKKGCHPFASKSFCTSVRSQLPGDDARLSHHKERHILRGPCSRWVGDR